MTSFLFDNIILLLLYIDIYENRTTTNSNKNRGLIKGNISSDGIIDDDFESELGGHESTVSRKKKIIFCFFLYLIYSIVCVFIRKYRKQKMLIII
jgi:hypothetical protein